VDDILTNPDFSDTNGFKIYSCGLVPLEDGDAILPA
jgi:hypothetical protein